MADDEAAIAQRMATELLTLPELMDVSFRPITVFQMVGLIQLALRHPHVPADIRTTAERFLTGAREYFADCPTVLDVVKRGDDPSQDVLRR